MLVVVGQPAAVLAQCVGRRYKHKLCEQRFGRTHVRTCLQRLREASVSPRLEAVVFLNLTCRAGIRLGFVGSLLFDDLTAIDGLQRFLYA